MVRELVGRLPYARFCRVEELVHGPGGVFGAVAPGLPYADLVARARTHHKSCEQADSQVRLG